MGEGSVRVGDIDVAYRIHGERGFPLVKIVGYTATMDASDPDLVEALSKRFRVLTFDNRGMGGTTAGTAPFSIGQFARDTVGLMDALGMSRAHLFGISMGGFIAQELTLENPSRVAALVLLNTSCGGFDSIPVSTTAIEQLGDFSVGAEERLDRVTRLLCPADWLEGHEAELREKLLRGSRPPDQESVKKQGEAMLGWRGSCERLPGLKAPTLVITGSQDAVIHPGNSVTIAGLIPGARLVQFDGAGHGLPYQCPEDLSAMILDFLPDDPEGTR